MEYQMSKAIATNANARNWNITGTSIYGATKEELKPQRTKLNADNGVYEKDGKREDQEVQATPSNKWPFRITKGPDHPHVSAK
jgi:hypothetical protein